MSEKTVAKLNWMRMIKVLTSSFQRPYKKKISRPWASMVLYMLDLVSLVVSIDHPRLHPNCQAIKGKEK